MMAERGFSRTSLGLRDSVTHGTRAAIAEVNQRLAGELPIIDLGIGTLDLPADPRIDDGVVERVRAHAEEIHAFAPVKGLPSLRRALAARIARLHGVAVDPEAELMVTPGGIKGALTVVFHTLLDPGDEVLFPVPNWPHYGDMARLHGAVPRPVPGQGASKAGLSPRALDDQLTDRTKLVILGDCINPTGKVYRTDELRELAQVIAAHNVRRAAERRSPVHVVFDCPYEAHILGPRARTFAAIEVDVPGHGTYAMRPCTVTVTGPGKTYGMHGDRIGYLWAAPDVIEMAARVQVNTNSFACTYGQVATERAVQPDLDDMVRWRAEHGRANLGRVLRRLTETCALEIDPPDGGYFLFAGFARHAARYERRGHERADRFLLREARVATISGCHFADGFDDELRHFVRINCGRSAALLDEACARIEGALARLQEAV